MQVFQIYTVSLLVTCYHACGGALTDGFPQPPDATEALESLFYILEIASLTSLKPSATLATSTPMQVLRDQAIGRVLEIKRLLKGLVNVARVE